MKSRISKNQTKLFLDPIIKYLPDSPCVLCKSTDLVSEVLFLTQGEPCKRFRKICDKCRLLNELTKE